MKKSQHWEILRLEKLIKKLGIPSHDPRQLTQLDYLTFLIDEINKTPLYEFHQFLMDDQNLFVILKVVKSLKRTTGSYDPRGDLESQGGDAQKIQEEILRGLTQEEINALEEERKRNRNDIQEKKVKIAEDYIKSPKTINFGKTKLPWK